MSWNGPPIAAGAVACRKPPMTHSIRTSPTTRLPANAPMTTSGRAVRSIIQIPISEARGEAGSDHLEEDRASVSGPQDKRCDQQHGSKDHPADHQRTRDPVRGPGGLR